VWGRVRGGKWEGLRVRKREEGLWWEKVEEVGKGEKGGRVRGGKWGGLRVWKREKGLAVRGGKMGERLGVENGKG
jgi:hypothetical protein